ncbi:HD domain-containing protein [Dasania sp. GY-MA-18]|uniref:HD domain-containing protein n=1 Tax=Dasania phycosphaerae TaxID=2950436 RepID=A0A9J6RL11_9GAMM|nr:MULTISPECIES: HD domain-containing phosphohydrolase [Dasania]MCR8922443.1 HD domain-containing protein [Dasania sp. GY-MA-18]MCZ0864871.1 HD domain-containing protein [Dasania phycosphaerae]MCZ0868599.1 HD domain-containing protein [Dasania phycosphaerae]
MVLFESDILEPTLTQQLVDAIAIHYQSSEQALLQLDSQPHKPELIQQLYRAVHNIKSDLGIVAFTPLMPLLSALDDLLLQVRQQRMAYSPLLGDLMLLLLDDAKTFVEDYQRDGSVAYDMDFISQITANIERLKDSSHSEREQLIAKTIRLLDPAVAQLSDGNTDSDTDDFLSAYAFSEQEELAFYRALMMPVEARSKFWAGRSDRILTMALSLNHLAGQPVDAMSLAVAVYVHDFGMAAIPVELLHKEQRLENDEIALLRAHVQSSMQLLKNMPRWQAAKTMVAQHHEAVDGTGYPNGLREEKICDGAKILAIADTFDALTHQRAYSSEQKRPIIRAVKTINDCAGKQLSEYWVGIFNQAISSIMSAHRQQLGGSARPVHT